VNAVLTNGTNAVAPDGVNAVVASKRNR
jgi:hypothetical protein